MKITYNIPKEVRISNIFKTSLENLTKMASVLEIRELNWCNGILFYSKVLTADDESIKSLTKDGILYIENLNYSECEDNISQAKWNGNSLEVFDMTGNIIDESITKFLKEMPST